MNTRERRWWDLLKNKLISSPVAMMNFLIILWRDSSAFFLPEPRLSSGTNRLHHYIIHSYIQLMRFFLKMKYFYDQIWTVLLVGARAALHGFAF